MKKNKKKKLGKKKIKATIEKMKTGFSAHAENLSVTATGKTISELENKMVKALNLHFKKEKIKVKPKNLELEIDIRLFFQYYKVLNAKFLADRIGMNPTLLSHYVQDRKKPSKQQLEKIIQGIQQMGKELAELRLVTR